VPVDSLVTPFGPLTGVNVSTLDCTAAAAAERCEVVMETNTAEYTHHTTTTTTTTTNRLLC